MMITIMIALDITDYILFSLPIKKTHAKEQPVKFRSS